MNQKQLMIAESTIGAKTAGWPISLSYGYNMMCMEELTKIAMERCSTARCAVQTMGDLAVEYGYYALGSGDPAAPGYAGAAEAVAVGDPKEAWIFHVMTGPNNASAVWAAQRVPDGHVSVMANAMIIRHMDLDDPDNFLASDNVHSFAIEQGWWEPEKGAFDFTAAYALDAACNNNDWEFPKNAMYSGRRMWRVFDLIAPSLGLDLSLGWIPKLPTYPFSVKPDSPITQQDVIAIIRDTYEGTQFDLSTGIKGGPFSSPLQYDQPVHPRPVDLQGGWERPIATYRMLYSFVGVARSWLPDHIGGLARIGLARSTSSVHVPFYAGHTEMPKSYLTGLESEFNTDSAWWAFSLVQNLAQIKWSVMFPDILAEQQRLESSILKLQYEVEAKAAKITETDGAEAAVRYLTEFSNAKATEVIEAWWQLGWRLLSTYSNGWVTHGESSTRTRPGYPAWWLEASGYFGWPHGTFSDPRSEDWCPSANAEDLAAPQALTAAAEVEEVVAAADWPSWNHFTVVLLGGAALAVAAGMALGYLLGSRAWERRAAGSVDKYLYSPLL